jgi:hypothetical protein
VKTLVRLNPKGKHKLLRAALTTAVQRHFPIHHYGHIPALHKKLHDLLAVSRHCSPPGSGIRILFEATYLFRGEFEIDQTQLVLRGPQNLVPLSSEHDSFDT